LHDLKHVCDVVGASYSEETTKKMLDIYATSFDRGAVLWRITDRPHDAVNYRFYERTAIDTIRPAIEAMILDPQNPMIPLVESWSSLYNGAPQQSCDFDAEHGLVKAWVYLGGMRPLDEILDAPNVPDTIRRHRHTFHKLNLGFVRHVAVDYISHTVNLYFRAPGPLSYAQAKQYSALAGSQGPSEAEFEELVAFLNPAGFTLSVTIQSSTGTIKRLAIYALRIPAGKFPVVNQRISEFFQETPSYDQEDFNAIAWSFGEGANTYLKAERSYVGELVQLTKGWNSLLS
jgi:4-hydroxyphenylpyruvate 3-dimethylallyltransferase